MDATQWKLFINSSKLSLKAVLLHNGNRLPSIAVGYAVHMKETDENMKALLHSIKYDEHKWKICGDLKDSRDKTSHYIQTDWPAIKLGPSERNVATLPLVHPKDIFLPPLHIILGLMKNFVKVMNKEGHAFRYSKKKFAFLSDSKLKKGVFVEPQIRELVKDPVFGRV